MWISISWPHDGDMAVVHHHTRERTWAIGAPPDGLASLTQTLRLGALDAPPTPPRCRACHHDLDVPPLDEVA